MLARLLPQLRQIFPVRKDEDVVHALLSVLSSAMLWQDGNGIMCHNSIIHKYIINDDDDNDDDDDDDDI